MYYYCVAIFYLMSKLESISKRKNRFQNEYSTEKYKIVAKKHIIFVCIAVCTISCNENDTVTKM